MAFHEPGHPVQAIDWRVFARDNKPSNFRFRPLGPGDCISCHYGEFSRPFEWDKFWPDVAHGKDAQDEK